MSDFVIPKGIDFTFRVNVRQHGNFLPQDLTDMLSAVMTVYRLSDQTPVGVGVSLSVDSGDITYDYALNGKLVGVVPAAYFSAELVDRGDAIDDYYLRSAFAGTIVITFTNLSTISPIVVPIDRITLTPTGL